MKALVIAHDHVSPIGPVGERLTARGYDLLIHNVVGAEDHLQPSVETDFPAFTDFDLIVPMGAPWSIYDHATVGSWVLPELIELHSAIAAGVPVLGICFGGQLLAEVHGGGVAESSTPEVGWVEVESSAPLIVPGGPWFEWHYDAWTVPSTATEIARNTRSSQAFVVGRSLAVQFHPELTSTMLEGWLAHGGNEKAREFGLDPEALLSETRAADERSRARAGALVDGFLDHVAFTEPLAESALPERSAAPG